MIVFKNYFKILRAHKLEFLIYSAIFIVLSLMAYSMGPSDQAYEKVEARMYLEDQSNSPLSQGLSKYLAKNNQIMEMDKEIVKDKLFYKVISLAVEIPENFEEDRLVQIMQAPSDIYAAYVKQDIEKYLSFVETYERAGYPTEEAIKKVEKDLDTKVQVSLTTESDSNINSGINTYFNFLAYVLLSQIILAVATISLTYRKETVYKRNLVSPMKHTRQTLEMILGHIVTGFFMWLSYIVLYGILWKETLFTAQVNLMTLNSLIFTITAICMATFFSNLVADNNSLQGIVNVVALGTCFVSGVFVPQSLLGDMAIKIGKLFPVYYYVESNNILNSRADFSLIRNNLLIMIAYALVFVVLTLMKKAKIAK